MGPHHNENNNSLFYTEKEILQKPWRSDYKLRIIECDLYFHGTFMKHTLQTLWIRFFSKDTVVKSETFCSYLNAAI